jgi:hypothetical protein
MNLLSLGILAFITLSGCQRTIQTRNVIQTKMDTSKNLKMKVDSTANINHRNVDTSKNLNMKGDTSKIESKLKAEDFTLSIIPKNFKNSTIGKAKLVITNNTNEQALAGLEYSVDVYQENKWKRLKLYIMFDLIGIELKPLSSRELDVNFKSLPYTNKIQPYNYKPGRYRIIKEIISSDKKRHFISTEFTVK